MQLHPPLPASRPGVGQGAAQLRVPEQRWQVVEHDGHADVVDRRVRELLDRPVRSAAAAEEPEVTGAGQRGRGVEVERDAHGPSEAPDAVGLGHGANLGPMSRHRIPWGSVLCKLLGVAGLAGVAATGVVAARDERRRRAYTPDEVRARLQERVAAAQDKAAQERRPHRSRAGSPGE